MGLVAIYVTYKNYKEANKIVSYLLDQNLIACANFFPIKSCSRWNGKIEKVTEMVSLLKTTSKNWPKIKSTIKKMHSYIIPCIIKFNIRANEDYEKWVYKETK